MLQSHIWLFPGAEAGPLLEPDEQSDDEQSDDDEQSAGLDGGEGVSEAHPAQMVQNVPTVVEEKVIPSQAANNEASKPGRAAEELEDTLRALKKAKHE